MMQSDSVAQAASPIVCRLSAGDYKESLRQIAELARDALRGYERNGLVLTLRYDAAAAERVREMVRRERDCCAFLTFDYREDDGDVVVTISAPPEAQVAAETMFEQFITPDSGEGSRAARIALACA